MNLAGFSEAIEYGIAPIRRLLDTVAHVRVALGAAPEIEQSGTAKRVGHPSPKL